MLYTCLIFIALAYVGFWSIIQSNHSMLNYVLWIRRTVFWITLDHKLRSLIFICSGMWVLNSRTIWRNFETLTRVLLKPSYWWFICQTSCKTTTNQYYPTFFNLEVVLNRSFKDVSLFLLDSYDNVMKNWKGFLSSE